MPKRIITKFFLLASCCFFDHEALAFKCPKSAVNTESSMEFLKSLKRFEGERVLGSCRIEIHVCDVDSAESDFTTDFAGEVFIRTKDNYERYVPLYFLENNSRRASQVEAVEKNISLYKFKDRNFDEKTGRYEKWAIQIRKSSREDLQFLEVAYHSQYLDQTDTEPSWVVCGTEREKFYENHPVIHQIQSWWTWVTKSNN